VALLGGGLHAGDQCRAAALASNPVCHAGFGRIDQAGRSAGFARASTIFMQKIGPPAASGTLQRRLAGAPGAAEMDSKADLC
jgi:hypothetical protein